MEEKTKNEQGSNNLNRSNSVMTENVSPHHLQLEQNKKKSQIFKFFPNFSGGTQTNCLAKQRRRTSRKLTLFSDEAQRFQFILPQELQRRKSAEGLVFGYINKKISFLNQLAPLNPNHGLAGPLFNEQQKSLLKSQQQSGGEIRMKSKTSLGQEPFQRIQPLGSSSTKAQASNIKAQNSVVLNGEDSKIRTKNSFQIQEPFQRTQTFGATSQKNVQTSSFKMIPSQTSLPSEEIVPQRPPTMQLNYLTPQNTDRDFELDQSKIINRQSSRSSSQQQHQHSQIFKKIFPSDSNQGNSKSFILQNDTMKNEGYFLKNENAINRGDLRIPSQHSLYFSGPSAKNRNQFHSPLFPSNQMNLSHNQNKTSKSISNSQCLTKTLTQLVNELSSKNSKSQNLIPNQPRRKKSKHYLPFLNGSYIANNPLYQKKIPIKKVGGYLENAIIKIEQPSDHKEDQNPDQVSQRISQKDNKFFKIKEPSQKEIITTKSGRQFFFQQKSMGQNKQKSISFQSLSKFSVQCCD